MTPVQLVPKDLLPRAIQDTSQRTEHMYAV